MTTAIYPGSFDPVTMGHIDVAKRASRVFDHVIVAIYEQSEKPGALFTTAERAELARQAFCDHPEIEVATFSGLAVNYARERGATTIVRGLRAVSDFEYEFKLAHMNAHPSRTCSSLSEPPHIAAACTANVSKPPSETACLTICRLAMNRCVSW